MSWYCDIAPTDRLHRDYHDREYGFPVADEAVLFERLSLEIFQAGLSWRLVLQKRPALAAAFSGFDADAVAAYGPDDLGRLLSTEGLIRNRRKLEAVIANAARVQGLRVPWGGFGRWLHAHHPRDEAGWLALFRQAFRFVGPQVVREFLLSTGYLRGAHRETCPVYPLILAARPPWLDAPADR